jgi:hypothetical protein
MSNVAEDRLAQAAVELATAVREGRGIDPQQEAEFQAALLQFGAATRDLATVPKSLASVLVELFPALVGSVGIYDAVTAREIEDLAHRLEDGILAALASHDSRPANG